MRADETSIIDETRVADSVGHEPPAIVVLGTVAELTQLGTGPGREDLAQGSAA